jgi:hypothetical protein
LDAARDQRLRELFASSLVFTTSSGEDMFSDTERRRIERSLHPRSRDATRLEWLDYAREADWADQDLRFDIEDELPWEGSSLSHGEPESFLRPVNGRWPPLIVTCVVNGAGHEHGCVGLFSSRALEHEIERLFCVPVRSEATARVSATMVQCARFTLAQRVADSAELATVASWGQPAGWFRRIEVIEEQTEWPLRGLRINVSPRCWDVPPGFFDADWQNGLFSACHDLLGPAAHWVEFRSRHLFSDFFEEEHPGIFADILFGQARKERAERRALLAALGSANRQKNPTPATPAPAPARPRRL